MRDALLLVFVLAALLATLRYPFVGLLTWAWFSLMTPHQEAYGAFGLPLNMMIAAATLASMAAHGWFGRLRMDGTTALILVFALLLCVSQAFSLDPANSAQYLDRFLKTLAFVLLCIQATTDKLRINALVWALVLSIGYFAARGALFTVVTLGHYHVFGPENTVLFDNNQLGIAIASILPLVVYLRGEAQTAALRWALMALFVAGIVCILGTQSRGAFVALMVYFVYYFLRSKKKLLLTAGLGAVLVAGAAFMPSAWMTRMETIGSATEDTSFMGRVNAWIINTKFALAHPLTGAGLRNPYEKELIATVAPDMVDKAAAGHSIYFEILGGAGFIALAAYLAILVSSLFKARAVERWRADAPPWIRNLAYAAQISLVVFMAGGASVSMEMWDGYWIVVAVIAAARRMIDKEAALAAAPEPNARQPLRRLDWRAGARGLAPRRQRG